MSAFVLKLIACISMLIDHSGYVIFGGFSFFNYIGRFAFPIFAFQIGEGYSHTKNVKLYLFKLIVFAIISQVPFMFFTNSTSLNIFFTLFLGLVGIICYDKSKNKFLGIIIGIILALIAQYIKTDYGFYGVAIIMLFYIFRNNKLNMVLTFLIATIIIYLIPVLNFGYNFKYMILAICTFLSIIFILLYNGKKGRSTKYLLYFFYPIHLFILYIISIYLF